MRCREAACGGLNAACFAYFCGMKSVEMKPVIIGSIAEFCRLMELPPPEHPLVSVIRFELIKRLPADLLPTAVLNFFSVWLKKEADMGVMRFFLPGQMMTREVGGELNDRGLWLMIHPELLWNYPVDKNLEQYEYFVNAVSEALRLVGRDEKMITDILQDIEKEYLPPTSACCQETILSQLDSLLVFARRLYRRQLVRHS
jgi:hypothetical protein